MTLTSTDCKTTPVIEHFRDCLTQLNECKNIEIKDSNAGSDTSEQRTLGKGEACKFSILNAQTKQKKKGYFSFINIGEHIRVYYADETILTAKLEQYELFAYQQGKHTPLLKDYDVEVMVINLSKDLE